MTHIHLLSESPIKVEALQYFTNKEILTHKTEGLVEQPEGISQTSDAAAFRRAQMIDVITDKYPVFSIENGIMYENGGYYDFCLVAYYNTIGGAGMIRSCAPEYKVEFPSNAVAIARQRGFKAVTVGKVLSEQYPDLDHRDPQSYLTQGRVTRLAQIKSALSQFTKNVF